MAKRPANDFERILDAKPAEEVVDAIGPGSEVQFVHMRGGPRIEILNAVATSTPTGVERTISITVPATRGTPEIAREDVPDEAIVGKERTPRWRLVPAAAAPAAPATPPSPT